MNQVLTRDTQIVNYSHLFPTRYALELEGLKGTVAADTFREPSQRTDAKKTIKKLLEDRYQGGKNKWFFQPLRVSTFHCSCVGIYFVLAGSLESDLPPHFSRFLVLVMMWKIDADAVPFSPQF